MKKKRRVSQNLGRTQHRHADQLYQDYKERYGPVRTCPFYGGSKYKEFDSATHNRLNPQFPNPNVPIENFDFMSKGSEWRLQSYCKTCYKAYRDARIRKAQSTWVNADGSIMTEDEIRDWYLENVGVMMQCSTCNVEYPPDNFRISRNMEKGLHNICFDCEVASGTSVREQEWLSDGDWSSWKIRVDKMHRASNVECALSSDPTQVGVCLGSDIGKRMHADHIVPLRAGGINDGSNFQPLCSSCNSSKSDQIDPNLSIAQIRARVGNEYKKIVRDGLNIGTLERRLKAELVARIGRLVDTGCYLAAIKAKKKEVNGQWDVHRTHRKGVEWLSRIRRGVER